MSLLKGVRNLAWNGFTDVHIAAYRLTGGRIGGTFRGVDTLLLDHVGRRSGKQRTNPLYFVAEGDDLVIVASRGGSHKHPAWWLNLRDSPRTTVQVGSEPREVVAREANDEERARLWPRLVEAWPDYEAYQRRTERKIPVIVLSPASAAEPGA